MIRVNSVLSFGLISTVLVCKLAGTLIMVLLMFFLPQLISASLNSWVQPFKTHRDNLLETVTIFAALFAYALAFTLSINELDYGSIPVVVFYFLVNFLVVVWCIVEFISAQMPRVKGFIKYAHTRSQRKVTVGSSNLGRHRRRPEGELVHSSSGSSTT